MGHPNEEWRLPQHFDGKRFYNPNGRQAPGFRALIRWKKNGHREHSPKFVDDVTPTVPPARVENGTLRVTMVNHSTVLLQQRGCNMITDPMWSERASPVAWTGPRRHRRPGVRWEDLPPMDIVLISHNHYDHLDMPILRRLKSPRVVPLGMGKLGRELDWGDSVDIAGCRIHCVPAMHFSARGLFDRNQTLWCGYVIECGGRLVYFAGDTAFGDHFAWIRDRFGAPDVALLPIGAYEPRWFMSPVHMAPDEAVRAHEILGAKASIAIHHGTFQLADEAIDTPRKRLSEIAGDARFRVLANGEFAEFA
jgi:L-ascorbate metabolism protein UlaG (beta-lactamase superfamily)